MVIIEIVLHYSIPIIRDILASIVFKKLTYLSATSTVS